jgi:hypothetical protein
MSKSRSELLMEKWAPVLDKPITAKSLRENYKRAVTAQILENQQAALRETAQQLGELLTEDAPANQSGAFPNASNLKGFDPILIALVRRAMPNLIAYDVCGVQPMSGPTGLIFAMRSKYTSQGGDEALFQEANTAFSSAGLSGTGSHAGTNPAGANSTNYLAGLGMSTLQGEGLGTSGNTAIPEMAFSIDKVTVTAKTRALKAEYSLEIAQDLKAIHGLEAENELANILSAELLAEINREVIRQIYFNAVPGAQHNVTTAGTFDLDTDSNGRWMVEKFKGLHFQIEREANAIAKATRRGRGNMLICSSDIASALAAADLLDYGTSIEANLAVDDTGPTFAGTLNGRYKVFIDPYLPTSGTNYFVVGYKGASPFDAGLFYCPYVPLQMVRAIDPGSFQPKIGFKTRYGMVTNPFCKASGVSDGTIGFEENVYYRKVIVQSLM